MTFQTKAAGFQNAAQIIPFPSARERAIRPDPGSALRRPPTLTCAARWRAARYQRARDLPRLGSGLSALRPGSDPLLIRLREIEEECWLALKAGAAQYSAERHVLAFAALIAEGGLPTRAAGHRARR